MNASIHKLQAYANRASARSPEVLHRRSSSTAEQCELCSIPLAPLHRHLLEPLINRLVCSCDPCALRFQNVVDGRFKLIPRDVYRLPDFQLDDALWESLAVPIELVFFFTRQGSDKPIALYPSPGGATESLLSLHDWDHLSESNPVLARMEPDVEALLVHRARTDPLYFLAPMDRCFALTGLLRVHWRGLSGGEEVWQHIDRFFATLCAEARPLPEVIHQNPFRETDPHT